MKHVRPSRLDDVVFLHDRLRDADNEELRAGGFAPFPTLFTGLLNSKPCLTMLTPGSQEPAGMLGVAPGFTPDMGVIWLLGTEALVTHQFAFLRNTRSVLKHFYETTGYQGLYNFSHAGNPVHHKWLRWLGFKFIERRKLGPHGEEFVGFVGLRSQIETTCAQ